MAQRSRSGAPTVVLALLAVAPLAAVLGGALVLGVARSSWAPWVVAAAALAAAATFSVVPIALGALLVVLAHPRSREWLADQVDRHLERRHTERLARAETPERHLHLVGGTCDAYQLPGAEDQR